MPVCVAGAEGRVQESVPVLCEQAEACRLAIIMMQSRCQGPRSWGQLSTAGRRPLVVEKVNVF